MNREKKNASKENVAGKFCSHLCRFEFCLLLCTNINKVIHSACDENSKRCGNIFGAIEE
jgi:hypothetical protein